MKPGSVIFAKCTWSMDDPSSGIDGISFDTRDCARLERFVVLTESFHIRDQYISTLVMGSNRIESITMWCTSMKAYKQKFVQYFKEVA